MINIKDKEECVGCGACVQRCPVGCIILEVDKQGFAYARADALRCIECGLCERVCPVIHPGVKRVPKNTLGCYNRDSNIVGRASSGGAFEQMVRETIAQGGVVFGAAFTSDWGVAHGYAETLDGCRQFSRSKYVQSRIGNTYVEAERFLKQGRKVLFSGTPCQISGLRLFLGREYDNLLMVDVACHGVPSPMVWRDYLKSVCDGHKVVKVDFRDKRNGWEKYQFVVETSDQKGNLHTAVREPFSNNIYMMGFLRNLYLRPSCYACPAKGGRSGADVTLADFWGVEQACPDIYNHDGVSLVLDYNGKFTSENMRTQQVQYETAVKLNTPLEESVPIPDAYELFWKHFKREGIRAVGRVLPQFDKVSFIKRIVRKIFG